MDFIADLLSEQKISLADKERLFSLIKDDVKQADEDDGKKLNEILETLKDMGKSIKQDNLQEQNNLQKLPEEQSVKLSGKFHKPQETKSFLSLFNNSEGLKYLTHKFNGDKPDYDEFIRLCKKEFDESKAKYPNIPDKLLRRIEEFAFAAEPKWFIRKGNAQIDYKNGWSEPTFAGWYKKDINTHPGLDAKWNNEMIFPFKSTIEVRAGNLANIINDSLKWSLGDSFDSFNVEMMTGNVDTAEFYTNVDIFQQALFHIFSTIKEHYEKNFHCKIFIDYENETLKQGVFKKLIITHIDSEATKISNDPEFVKGDLKSIQQNLWGLCNYEIQAKFPDGYKGRIILTDNLREINKSYDLKTKVKGFSHILKFY
jgi:hypothetical protein